jgi:hypothetical protein
MGNVEVAKQQGIGNMFMVFPTSNTKFDQHNSSIVFGSCNIIQLLINMSMKRNSGQVLSSNSMHHAIDQKWTPTKVLKQQDIGIANTQQHKSLANNYNSIA